MNRIIIFFILAVFFFGFQKNFGQEQNKTSGQVKTTGLLYCQDVYHNVVNLPKPEYPKAARAVRASGDVCVRILIDENGSAVEANAISGHPLLVAASVRAALQAKFRPITNGGKPVKGYVSIKYRFVSDDFQLKETPKNIPKAEPVSISIGKAIKLIKPPFPTGCRCKISRNNKITVEFTVNESGNVVSASAIAGHPLLRAVSIAAIRNSKFSASLIGGMPVKAYGAIIYDFVLRKNRWKSRIIKYELTLDKISRRTNEFKPRINTKHHEKKSTV